MILVLIFNVIVVGATTVPWLDQITRQEILISGCERLKNNKLNFTPKDFDHILIDHKHKFLYCYVPKVACTNWKRVLMVLTERVNTTNVASISASLAHSDGSLLKLSELPEEEAKGVLNSYMNFVMVRHPFERLLSAYRNKLEDTMPSAKYFQSVFGRHIIKNYRKNPSMEDLKTGANVTFREFVQYLIAEGTNTNEHWRTVYELCHPCYLNYSFIGKYDSFAEDAKIVLGLIGAPDLTFPQTRSMKTGNRLRQYYQQISLEEIEKLYRLYETDFKLFGYTMENILGFDFG